MAGAVFFAPMPKQRNLPVVTSEYFTVKVRKAKNVDRHPVLCHIIPAFTNNPGLVLVLVF